MAGARGTGPELAALIGAEEQPNKYSEGYPGRRYYEGQQNIDPVERLAIARAPRSPARPAPSWWPTSRASPV